MILLLAQLFIVNEATIAARIEDTRNMEVAHVYPGMQAVMPLLPSSLERYVIVDTGSRRWKSLPFRPNDVLPYWKLIIKQPPMLPDGPHPVACDGR